jgi:hypothetical protein
MTPPWQRPVVLVHNGHGDKLLTLPALRALCSLLPGRLRLICNVGDGARFYTSLAVHETCEIAFRRGPERWHFDAAEAARAIGDADALLFPNTWFNDDVAQLLARFPRAESAGYFPEFTHCLREGRLHAADQAFQIPRWLDPTLRLEDFSYPPRFDPQAVEAALRIRETLGPPRRVLVVHMTTRTNKMWPLASWLELLDAFLGEHPDYVAFIVGPEPFELAIDGARRIIPIYGLSLPVAFALVGTADLFVGIDSCMLHAADLYRVPGVGLFGPTSERRWGFRFGPHRHVRAPGAMEALAVGEVLAALEALVPQYPSVLAV